jgi:hypothetical protein
MFARNQMRLLPWVIPIAVVGLLSNSLWAAAPEPDKEHLICVTTIDFDECEPLLIRSKIMEVHPQKGTLVVAEREVREMDVTSEGRRIKTVYLNLDGKAGSRGSFRVGQYVRVKGVLHPEGYIAAFVVQQIDKPIEKNLRYNPIESERKSFRKAPSNRNVP